MGVEVGLEAEKEEEDLDEDFLDFLDFLEEEELRSKSAKLSSAEKSTSSETGARRFASSSLRSSTGWDLATGAAVGVTSYFPEVFLTGFF